MSVFTRLFSWLGRIFRSDRAKVIRKLLPAAIEIARRIASRDWDKDGAVEGARDEIVGVLTTLPSSVAMRVFSEYLGAPQGVEALNSLPARVIKKVLAIALLAERLVAKREEVPSYGLLDTAAQLAYESIQKDNKVNT